MRNLIINADDCNLTAGVTRAILDCHLNGIVSSTSWLVNLPYRADDVIAIGESNLGVGLHLNVSLGAPVSDAEAIPSLVTSEGLFKKSIAYESEPPASADLIEEYSNQLTRFRKIFGIFPTHLDTHHQLHDQSIFMSAVANLASKYNLPIRRSSLMDLKEFTRTYPEIVTTQVLFGELDANYSWSKDTLKEVLEGHWEGSAEVMCHPGVLDDDLKNLSSMTVSREREYELFSSSDLKNELQRRNIRLIHFGQLSR